MVKKTIDQNGSNETMVNQRLIASSGKMKKLAQEFKTDMEQSQMPGVQINTRG